MRLPEFDHLDATALAALVRDGEVSPEELLDAALERIHARNPTVNAVIDLWEERARSGIAAGLPEGPFRGVPFVVKDELAVEGQRMTLGSALLHDHVSDHSHEIARRLEAAGLVLVGRTNMCELGLLPTTEPVLHGPTRNPWSLGHSSGGSSGGTAAAVAARMVPAGQGSDGGGSLRIPAAACGLFGLKPSRGRNPGDASDEPIGYVVFHALTRSVRDSAAILDATRGPLPGDGWWLPEPERPYVEEAAQDPKPLRIAFTTTDFAGIAAHPTCAAAVHEAARLLEDLGHHVEEAAPAIDGAAYNEAFVVLWTMMAGYIYRLAAREALSMGVPRRAGRLLRRPGFLEVAVAAATGTHRIPFEPVTRRLARMGTAFTPGDLWLAWNDLHAAGRALSRFLVDCDLLLTPTLGEPTWELGHLDQRASTEVLAETLFRYVGFTPVCNTAGLPAMSVPLVHPEGGLPVGVQLIAPLAREDRLFALAGQLERAVPWAGRSPLPLQAG